MKKVFIYLVFTILIPSNIDTMFTFWSDYRKQRTLFLKEKATKLADKNKTNLPLQYYLKSIEAVPIDQNNVYKIQNDLQTLLFIGNTHVYERLQSTALEENNIPKFSWYRPWVRPIAQISNIVQEVPAIATDTKDSLRFSDIFTAGCGVVIADSLVRRNSDNFILTLLAMPLYFIVPLTAICFKKCSWDMNRILQNNSLYLDTANTQLNQINKLLEEELDRNLRVSEALEIAENQLGQEKKILQKTLLESCIKAQRKNFLLKNENIDLKNDLQQIHAKSVIERAVLKRKFNKDLSFQEQTFNERLKNIEIRSITSEEKNKITPSIESEIDSIPSQEKSSRMGNILFKSSYDWRPSNDTKNNLPINDSSTNIGNLNSVLQNNNDFLKKTQTKLPEQDIKINQNKFGNVRKIGLSNFEASNSEINNFGTFSLAHTSHISKIIKKIIPK